jgi:hypothetical protein
LALDKPRIMGEKVEDWKLEIWGLDFDKRKQKLEIDRKV